jgi:hypothetical protein
MATYSRSLICPARPWPDVPLVLERRLARPQNLADRIAGHLQVPRDLPDRLAFDKMLAPNPADRLWSAPLGPDRLRLVI